MEPESLCARVVRSIYYLTGDFLEARLGARPSYAWRSILFGRDLLLKGLRRNVGSGETINVWMDKWLFAAEPIAPMRKQIIYDLELRVCDLINPQTRTWDRGKLVEVFFQSDIEKILKIKPAFGTNDSYEWVHNKWGAYSVRSGYWLACSLDQTAVRVSAQTKPSLNDLRSQVWKISTAPKIKKFLWKALSNALGVADECIARGMKVDPRCPKCGEEGESINHVLFTCPAARLVWANSGFPFLQRGFEHCSLYTNVSYLISKGKDQQVSKEIGRSFPWILWMLWKNKNAFIFEGKHNDADETVAKCLEDSKRWFDVLETAKRDGSETKRRGGDSRVWKAPERGVVKCNIGISWIKKTRVAGMGWIVRNSEGVTVLHSRRAFSGVPSLLEAKRLGLVWAAESMLSHKIQRVRFEVEDCEVVGAVNRPKAWPAYRSHGGGIREIMSKIADWEVLLEER
ncbi:uncharacterized protein LOC130495690 [Raphanus sativus]|uniref:Uncharacterized protein LOC130495690 n=1 Tax=Raphanus sativus TaxID=3726 RepID=A0A9W3BVB6_RAPSA|nr:uncharacterized protein LOC130495690 [Raphanus sativus]